MDYRLLDNKEKSVFGRITTLQKMIDKRKERIETNKLEIKEFQKELKFKQKELEKITNTFSPNVSFIKKRNRIYTYYIGRVRFWKKPIEFHIGDESIFKSRSKDYWISNVQKRFRKRLNNKDFKDYLGEYTN
jgi:hypothetical protein